MTCSVIIGAVVGASYSASGEKPKGKSERKPDDPAGERRLGDPFQPTPFQPTPYHSPDLTPLAVVLGIEAASSSTDFPDFSGTGGTGGGGGASGSW